MKSLRSYVLPAFVSSVILFLFAPLLLLVLFSFHNSPSLAFPFEGFSTRWYSEAVHSSDVTHAVVKSLQLAAIAAAASTVTGTLAALAVTRFPTRGSLAIHGSILLPAALPQLVIGVALLTVFVKLGLQLSIWTAAIGHVLYTLPFVYLVAYARLSRTDPLLEEVARDLGANGWQVFTKVTMPIVRPAILGGALVAIALSWDEFFIAFLTIGNDVTVPVLVWTKIRRAVDPSVNAISTVLLIASLLLAVIAAHLNRRRP